jgi:hypothetical protein
MNDNIIRHKVLNILAEKSNKNTVLSFKGENTGEYTVPFETLIAKIKCSETEMVRAISLLLTNKEVYFYNVEFKGFFIEDNGLNAYSTNKYLAIYRNNIFQIAKDVVQIFIPVISMAIALVAVSNNGAKNIDKLETELQKTQLQLTVIQTELHKPLNRKETYPLLPHELHRVADRQATKQKTNANE